MFGRILAAVAGLCLLLAIAPAQAEPRVALVIGNSNYGEGIGKLPNPANDAALMTTALQLNVTASRSHGARRCFQRRLAPRRNVSVDLYI